MDTQPMPLEAMAASQPGLDAFRLGAAAEVATLLRRLQEGNVQLNLNVPGRAAYTTTLWATDAANGVVSFAADPKDPRLQGLLGGGSAIVVGYLENVKVQFNVDNLLLVRGTHASAIRADYPGALYRFQRRQSFRVRPVLRDAPTARLPHPAAPERTLALRVLDVSIGGCALLLPENVAGLSAGARIERARFELDPGTRFDTALRLQHVTSIQPGAGGARLGCEFLRLGAEGERTLQRYIDQTQKRRRFLAGE